MERSRVYKITCRACCAIYIGETCRKLHIRFNEHINAFIKNCPCDSTVAANLLESGHLVDNVEVVLLYEVNLYNMQIAFEALEIYKHRKSHHTLINKFIPDHNLIKKLYT